MSEQGYSVSSEVEQPERHGLRGLVRNLGKAAIAFGLGLVLVDAASGLLLQNYGAEVNQLSEMTDIGATAIALGSLALAGEWLTRSRVSGQNQAVPSQE